MCTLYFSIGEVLMRDIHMVSFERKKLQDHEWRYPVHEKEMTAIVQCLQTWRHYLLGKLFFMKKYNVAMNYFAT
jgi:hypothetical protein